MSNSVYTNGQLEAGVSADLETPHTIRVTDATQLKDALAAATGGETIVLADGDYGALEIMSRDFAETVTLLSETPNGASVSELRVEKASNLAFDGFLFDYDDVETSCHFSIKKASDITIRNSHFEGAELDQPGAVNDGYPIGRALNVKSSEGILIEDNEFSTFWKGMGISLSEDVTVRGNEIHDIRSDGINITRSDGVLLEANHIHDFRLNPDSGDHADMIQVYSYKSGIVPRNITITGNYLDIGDGQAAHGIFFNHADWIVNLRAENGLETYFENIEITENVIVGGHVHGIGLNVTRGAVIANNTLVSQPGSDLNEPRLTVNPNNTDVIVTGNMAKIISADPADPSQNWTVENNALIQYDDPAAPNYYGDIFVNALSDATNAPENLQMLPDAPLTLAGVGASQLRYDDTPDTLVALARPETGRVLNEVILDAGFSAGPDGPAAAQGATFHWDFGDGTQATGVSVTHRYLTAGTHTAVLTVTLPDGSRDTSEVVTVVEGSNLLRYDAALDALVMTLAGEETVIGGDPVEDTVSDGPVTLAAAMEAETLNLAPNHTVVLPAEARAAFEGVEDFDIALSIQATEPGSLITSKGTFAVQINQDGSLQFGVNGDKLVTEGVDLLDGQWHEVKLSYDGADGVLALQVGDLAFERAITAGGLGGLRSDIKIGAAGKSDGQPAGGARAEIRALDIDIEADSYDMSPPPVSGALEVGTLEVTQNQGKDWHSVDFEGTIEDARVIMGPLSYNGEQMGTVRVRNVTDQGFEFQVEEFGGNGGHVMESVSWIAASAGTHRLATGETVIVGRTQAEDDDPVEVSFADAFGMGEPTVFAQVTSHNGYQTVAARVLGVDADGFDVLLQEEEASDGVHLAETIDWIALERGDAFDFQALSLTDAAQPVTEAEAEGALAVLAAMQSANETDPSVLRLTETDQGLEVFVQECQTLDAELAHAAEDVHILQMNVGLYDLFA